jgi:hypothetical protein
MTKSPFLESISDFMLTRRYNKRTIDTYLLWIKAFIVYCLSREKASTRNGRTRG